MIVRLALFTTVCNSTDYAGRHGEAQIFSALMLAASIRMVRSTVQLVAMTYGFNSMALANLTHAGYKVRDYSDEAPDQFAMVPRFTPKTLRRWPREPQSNKVQKRRDSVCTSFKFHAWDAIDYDGILLADTDVVFREDPLPWMRARLVENEYFHANSEIAYRNYVGINSHLIWLQPDRQIYRMLVDAAQLGNFIPYTNGDQDVIESLFTNHRPKLSLPAHLHSKNIYCSCASLLLREANASSDLWLDGKRVYLNRVGAFDGSLCPPQRRLVDNNRRCVADGVPLKAGWPPKVVQRSRTCTKADRAEAREWKLSVRSSTVLRHRPGASRAAGRVVAGHGSVEAARAPRCGEGSPSRI
ncbi:hypothetical protein AB1Y20_012815 [Prymnesium parvum]|uniref:Nucleotide-diphospho-sugar transferase domain-containing protein n=1 Tax=Prymnesium parvum TaxID=97485 RepID=A0AB34IKW9_PRYPA